MKKSLVPFIVFLILWLASLLLWFNSYSKIEDAQKNLKNSKSSLNAVEMDAQRKNDRLQKVSNLVGFHIPVEDEGLLLASTQALIHKLDTICGDGEQLAGTKADLGVSLPAQKIDKIKLFQDEYAKGLSTLEDVWEKYVARINQLQAIINKKSKEEESLKEEYKTLVTQNNTDINRLYGEIRQKREELEQLRKSKEEELREAEEARMTAQQEKITTKDKMAQLSWQNRDLEKKFKVELEDLEQRIFELQAEAEKSGDTPKEIVTTVQEKPDGAILYVNENLKIAYIDLGRGEGVLPGLKFDVFRYAKGGKKRIKGKIEVKEVRDKMSMVGITNITDELDPIAVGDQIINPVYDRNKVKYFVVAGRLSQKYSWEDAARLIEKLGGKLEKEITAKTDFVVLAGGFEKDPLYQRSVELGIETMLESEFVNYLSY